jgi:lipid-A-disaccharide synthase
LDIQRAACLAGVDEALTLLDGQSHTALAACDLTLIASGTATLEAALFKRPMVIAYNMPWLSWQIMRRKQRQPWVGLPNILCGEFVVPELLQAAATPQALAQSLLDWLASPERMQALQQRFTTLHTDLSRDTTRLACDVIQTLCERKHAP